MMESELVGKRRVLIVDDDEMVREILAALLGDVGYDVTAVADGATALTEIEAREFGVAIVDKNMPDISGLEVLRRAREVAPLLRGILYTGYASQESAIEALQAGAFDYAEKPIENDLLVERVHRAWRAYLVELERHELFHKYETLFEIVPGIVWFMTEDGVIKRINHEGAAMLGYGPADLCETPAAELIHEDESDDARWAFAERRTGSRATRRRVVQLRTRNGGVKVFEITSIGAYDRSTNEPHKQFWGTLGVGWDVTERAALEEQLNESRRVEAIGRVAGAVAHDFNNYLSVILNATHYLKRDLFVHDDRFEEFQEIELAASHAAKLTSQLLAVSRKQVIQPKALSLADLVGETERMLQRLLDESIDLDLHVETDSGLIQADAMQIEQVLFNLAANARDALPNGGRVRIDVSDVVVDAEAAAHNIGVEPGTYVLLSVADDGEGMTKEVRHHLFEAFYTTKDAGKGTGLGMATVHGIVTQLGGFITVDSSPGAGATIKVYLPRVEGEMPVTTREAQAPSSLGTETVLLVEDEAMMRRMARRVLQASGYTVVEATDGGDALTRYNQDGSTIDLVVTDLVMPKVSGTELAKRLRERDPALPIVYMTGYAGEAISNQTMFEEGACFLQKPFTGTTLVGMVRALLDDAAAA